MPLAGYLLMPFLSTLPLQELNAFLKVIHDSLSISRHQQLYQWLHDEVQHFIPHDILITAWGDFSLGLIHIDIISDIPGVRTTEIEKAGLLPFLLELFHRWVESDRVPFSLRFDDEVFHFCYQSDEYDFGNAISQMRSALIHGIKDERGRHDCIYVALSSGSTFSNTASRSLELLLPYVDAALRQITHLPVQYPDLPEIAPEKEEAAVGEAHAHEGAGLPWELSKREMEIMRWVCMGKTNSEIGQILDISFFTVKNHLQRIFRKIDVLNRAQAVAKFERVIK
jgi:transcriptional regulator EpsA